jgi:hypothetical protein
MLDSRDSLKARMDILATSAFVYSLHVHSQPMLKTAAKNHNMALKIPEETV